jgi:hypothetical protein
MRADSETKVVDPRFAAAQSDASAVNGVGRTVEQANTHGAVWRGWLGLRGGDTLFLDF